MWLHPASFWTGVLQPGQYFHPFFRIIRSNPCCLQLCLVRELARGLRHSLHHEWRHAGNGQMIIRWSSYSPRSTFIVCLHLGQCKMTECALNWRAYNFSRSSLERSSLSTTACVIWLLLILDLSIAQTGQKIGYRPSLILVFVKVRRHSLQNECRHVGSSILWATPNNSLHTPHSWVSTGNTLAGRCCNASR